MNLDNLQTSITLANEETSDDAFGTLLGAISVTRDRLKEMQAAVEAKMVEKIKATGRDIVIGAIRFYVGTPKKVKCRNVVAAINQILITTSGDVERLASCLAADAFKYGTVEKLFAEFKDPARFPELFEVTRGETLEEGKPVKVKRLLSVNEAYGR